MQCCDADRAPHIPYPKARLPASVPASGNRQLTDPPPANASPHSTTPDTKERNPDVHILGLKAPSASVTDRSMGGPLRCPGSRLRLRGSLEHLPADCGEAAGSRQAIDKPHVQRGLSHREANQRCMRQASRKLYWSIACVEFSGQANLLRKRTIVSPNVCCACARQCLTLLARETICTILQPGAGSLVCLSRHEDGLSRHR
jgi:hypothetical protein